MIDVSSTKTNKNDTNTNTNDTNTNTNDTSTSKNIIIKIEETEKEPLIKEAALNDSDTEEEDIYFEGTGEMYFQETLEIERISFGEVENRKKYVLNKTQKLSNKHIDVFLYLLKQCKHGLPYSFHKTCLFTE